MSDALPAVESLVSAWETAGTMLHCVDFVLNRSHNTAERLGCGHLGEEWGTEHTLSDTSFKRKTSG